MSWRRQLNTLAQHRTNSGPFDVVGSDASPLGDAKKGREIVNAFRDAGATWWLEWLDEQRGTFAQMREHTERTTKSTPESFRTTTTRRNRVSG